MWPKALIANLTVILEFGFLGHSHCKRHTLPGSTGSINSLALLLLSTTSLDVDGIIPLPNGTEALAVVLAMVKRVNGGDIDATVQ